MARAMVLLQPGDVAVDAVTSAFERHGLVVIRTFDLRQQIGSDETASAPVERSVPCICQYVVLLTYGGGEGPVVVTARSDDHATHFQVLPGIADRAALRLRMRVETALRRLVWTTADEAQAPGPCSSSESPGRVGPQADWKE